MTERRRRFLRLASLRERQHDETAARLRAARGLLDTKAREAEQHQQGVREAFAQQDAALREADHSQWMLACALSELASLRASQSRNQCAELAAAVAAAELEEKNARRERRQTERMVDSIREEENAEAALNEQKTLDESAQLLKMRSSKQGRELGLFS